MAKSNSHDLGLISLVLRQQTILWLKRHFTHKYKNVKAHRAHIQAYVILLRLLLLCTYALHAHLVFACIKWKCLFKVIEKKLCGLSSYSIMLLHTSKYCIANFCAFSKGRRKEEGKRKSNKKNNLYTI